MVEKPSTRQLREHIERLRAEERVLSEKCGAAADKLAAKKHKKPKAS